MSTEPAPESAASSSREKILAELLKFAEEKLADKSLTLKAEDPATEFEGK